MIFSTSLASSICNSRCLINIQKRSLLKPSCKKDVSCDLQLEGIQTRTNPLFMGWGMIHCFT